MATQATCTVAGEESATLAPFPDGGNPPDAVIFDLDGTLTETELLKAPPPLFPPPNLTVAVPHPVPRPHVAKTLP